MESETFEHALRDCTKVVPIWTHFSTLQNFFTENFETWLQSNSTNNTKNRLYIPWCTIFLFTIRSIWLAKNKFIFNNQIKPEIANLAHGEAAEFRTNNNVQISPSVLNPTRTTILPWTPSSVLDQT